MVDAPSLGRCVSSAGSAARGLLTHAPRPGGGLPPSVVRPVVSLALALARALVVSRHGRTTGALVVSRLEA